MGVPSLKQRTKKIIFEIVQIAEIQCCHNTNIQSNGSSQELQVHNYSVQLPEQSTRITQNYEKPQLQYVTLLERWATL